MLPNWLYGKSKSKLAELLGGSTPSDYAEVKAQVTQLTEDTTLLITNLNANGCKNHLKVNIATYTRNGITITVNADGSVTLNGTCSKGASFGIISGSAWPMNKGTYRNVAIIDSGTITCPLGKNVYFTSKYGTTQYTVLFSNISSKVTKVSPNPFTIANDGDTIDVYFYIDTDVVFNNCTIYPMILDSDCTDYSWSPYAKTNKELTDDVANIGATIVQKVSPDSSGTAFDISFSNASYPRALLVSNYTYGTLAYWSGTLHYIPIAKNDSMASVTASNESSNGIRLTFSSNDTPILIPLNTDASIWAITKVS